MGCGRALAFCISFCNIIYLYSPKGEKSPNWDNVIIKIRDFFFFFWRAVLTPFPLRLYLKYKYSKRKIENKKNCESQIYCLFSRLLIKFSASYCKYNFLVSFFFSAPFRPPGFSKRIYIIHYVKQEKYKFFWRVKKLYNFRFIQFFFLVIYKYFPQKNVYQI